MDTTRHGVLTALQDVPESLWMPILWAMLAALETYRTDGLPQHYATLQLKAAILSDFAGLDRQPARGTPERP